MRSQLKSIFELRYINLNRSIDKIATLVESYSVMLIVVLCVYILFVILSSSSVMDVLGSGSAVISPYISYLIAFVFLPVMSFIFIMMAHNMQRSSFPQPKRSLQESDHPSDSRVRSDSCISLRFLHCRKPFQLVSEIANYHAGRDKSACGNNVSSNS
jgi:uncharacterized membrane protein (DUF485 family)